MRRVVIIPAHDEEPNIPGVLAELRQHLPDADVVVIDDGSVDGTAGAARAHGALVLSHTRNRGYGAALVTGYRHAVDQRYDVIVRMDADGQHDPAGIGVLLDTLRVTGCDIVIGSRALGGYGYRPSLPRRAGIVAFSLLGRALLGTRVTDPTSGFAVMNRRASVFLARNTPDDYPDLNVRLAMHRAGLRTVEAPATMRARSAGKSMFSATTAFYYLPKMLLYLCSEYFHRREIREPENVARELTPPERAAGRRSRT